MHLGEFKFKQKSSKDDQAVADETAAAAKVAKLLGEAFVQYSLNNLGILRTFQKNSVHDIA